jgi:hypothetical protein
MDKTEVGNIFVEMELRLPKSLRENNINVSLIICRAMRELVTTDWTRSYEFRLIPRYCDIRQPYAVINAVSDDKVSDWETEEMCDFAALAAEGEIERQLKRRLSLIY